MVGEVERAKGNMRILRCRVEHDMPGDEGLKNKEVDQSTTLQGATQPRQGRLL